MEAFYLQQLDTVTWLLASGASLNGQGKTLSEEFTDVKKNHGTTVAVNSLHLVLKEFRDHGGDPADVLGQPLGSTQGKSLLRELARSDQSPALLTALEDLGANWDDRPPEDGLSALGELAARARGADALSAVAHFESGGRIFDFVNKAMDAGNMDVVTTRLNRGRPGSLAVAIGGFDEEAETVTARHRFGGDKLEGVKKDHAKGLGDSVSTTRAALHKALTYATEHVVAGSTAPRSRLNAWKALAGKVAASAAAKDDPTLVDLARHVTARLGEVQFGLLS